MSVQTVFYESCLLCPRRCGINRNSGKAGFCTENADLKIAWAGLHFGEEPFITGFGGSGTIFITGCNLKCAFCQNYQISQQGMGAVVDSNDFTKICLELQKAGAENINIVTGSHAIGSLAPYLRCAKAAGLEIPVCWNCSAYETVEALELLSDVVDIWLPDLKTLNPIMSEAVFAAKDYPQVAKKAIRWMIEHTETRFTSIYDKQGKKQEKMLSGVIVRHLVLPGRIDDTVLVLDWFKKFADEKAYLSLMSQYTPVPFVESELKKREKALSAFQNRYIAQDEFDKIQELIESFEIENGFYQELVQDTEWLPDFNRVQPFSSELARPIWHWSKLFDVSN
ncbi:MAG: radical SAM protein [Treponemataceae bacterium]|nr:radical SAM protein [Treponemataceae bacterium]